VFLAAEQYDRIKALLEQDDVARRVIGRLSPATRQQVDSCLKVSLSL
jgi:hypothetical protein